MKSKKRKFLTLLVISILMTTGCTKKEAESISSEIVEETLSVEKTLEITSEYIKEINEEITTEEINTIITELFTETYTETPTTDILETTSVYTPVELETNNESEIINDVSFKSTNEELEKLYKENFDTFKSYSKTAFIRIVDFIFYGEEINGTAFNKLNEEGKEIIYNEFKDMVNLINSYDSSIIPSLEEKYSNVVSVISEEYTNATKYVKEKIGQEKYDSIIEKKDEIVSDAASIANSAGNKIKTFTNEKYQAFKNNSED